MKEVLREDGPYFSLSNCFSALIPTIIFLIRSAIVGSEALLSDRLDYQTAFDFLFA